MRLSLSVLVLAVLAVVSAVDWYVDPIYGSDYSSGASADDAFLHISQALDSMSAGDAIILAAGSYTGPGLNCDLDIDIDVTFTSSVPREAVFPICHSEDDDDEDSVFNIRSDNDVGFYGISFYGCAEAIGIDDNAVVRVENCEFSFNQVAISSEDIGSDGSLTVADSFFQYYSDNAIYIEGDDDGDLRISSSTFAKGTDEAWAAIEVFGLESVQISSSSFYQSSSDGGALDIDEVDLVSVRASRFSQDSFVNFEDIDSLTVQSSLFSNNRKRAVRVTDIPFFRFSNVTMSLNEDSDRGAALYIDNSSGTIESSVLSNNTVYDRSAEGGGALYASDSRVLLSESVVEFNRVTTEGGAGLLVGSVVQVENSKVSGNMANVAGAFQCDDSHLYVSNSLIEDNQSLSGDEGECQF